jgi:large subunit ribosomal protein L4e
MKANIFNIKGEKTKQIELPGFFSEVIREDLISKIIETKKTKQPYAPEFGAGNKSSASGGIVHKRHVWKSQYGRGMSRIPRKTMSRSGTQFRWIGTNVPNTRGGRRAHPPKVISMINTKKINKKEEKLGLKSAISATANKKFIQRKYSSLKDEKLGEFPLIVEDRIISLKTKELISLVKKILGEKVFEVALRKKSIRSGKGKMRGRKYKESAGLLLVIGNNEKIKTSIFESVNANKLGVMHLAEGNPGRLIIYTEKAIKDLGEKLK